MSKKCKHGQLLSHYCEPCAIHRIQDENLRLRTENIQLNKQLVSLERRHQSAWAGLHAIYNEFRDALNREMDVLEADDE